MPEVSWSEVKLYRKCMKAHDYRYGQKLEKKKPQRSLIKGKILHEMLDAFIQAKRLKDYTGKDPWGVLDEYEEKYASLFAEEREEYGNIIEDCGTIFENYVGFYRDETYHYEESEVFVATDLTDDIRLIGYIDKVATDSQNRRWVIDHKFVKNIPTEDDQFPEIQLLIYLWAWNRFNPSRLIDGIIWDFARTKVPTEPEVLKNGTLSKRKNIDATQKSYLQAIAKHNQNPAEYADILQHLDGNETKFFRRIKLPRPSESMIQNIVDDFKMSALMIQKLKGFAPRNMSTFNCKTCEYRSLCEAEVRGLDAEFVRKTQYQVRQPSREKNYATQETE